MSAKRIIIISLFAILSVFVIIGFCFFTDTDDDPPTLASKASGLALVIVAWPVFALTAKLPGGWFTDTEAYSLMLFLLIPTGLFWGVVIDFIYSRIRRKRPNTALEPTPTAPSVSDKP